MNLIHPCGDDDLLDCINTVGSYICSCKLGYHTNETGGDCIDVDECALDTNDCQQNCSNTIGGYDCLCERGYKVVTSNPSECEDVDECSSGLDNCEQVCINLNGGYNCSCYEKFFKNGTKCRPLEECDNSTCVNGACYVVRTAQPVFAIEASIPPLPTLQYVKVKNASNKVTLFSLTAVM
ncbi:putative latent-transforming growth factor beta-binding protein 2-like [Apostichopus japonicus]|uniref:Putative latent-transforming growth factor beta-binding protein 2-like n=1 Tax=Stichopus japonicus TaxID=307972 RepID=A0A2G8KZA9_STIJA|nr:putative latent-transforming growth factor beta-binding protein 2-like [Apostichopus japonicus]